MGERQKGYQLDEDEQQKYSALPGVTIYTLGSAVSEALMPVFDWFLQETGCSQCAAEKTEKELMEALPEVVASFRINARLCKEHGNH